MKYKCLECGYIYDEDGIDPLTGEKNLPWDELSEDWVCPECGAPKTKFQPLRDEELDNDGFFEDESEEEELDDDLS